MNVIDLFEKRKNNNTYNKAGKYLDQVTPYFDQKGVYVSYQRTPKIGVNPRQMDISTPSGFYAYPLESKHVQSKIVDNKLEYGNDFPYVFLIHADTTNEISNHSNVNEHFLKLEAHVKRHIPHYYETFLAYTSRENTTENLYSLIKKISREVGKKDFSPGMMNKLLRICDIEILTDLGDGFISMEMSQSIFLTKTPIESLDKFYNIFPNTKGEFIHIMKNISADYDIAGLLISLIKPISSARRTSFSNTTGTLKKWIDMDLRLTQKDCYNIISGEGWEHIRSEIKERIDQYFKFPE